MKQYAQEKKHGVSGGRIRRMILLLLIGFAGFGITGSNARTDADTIDYGAFSWENYRTVVHALGGMEGKNYLNSKEGFQYYYQKGCRLFEVDLTRTSDDVWVCRHNWKEPMGQWEGENSRTLTEEEFLSSPIYGRYTPMSLKDLFQLLKGYPDAYVLLDCKRYSVRNYQKTVEDYAEYREIAREAGAEEVLDRLIPEIYNEGMYSGIALVHRFPGYLYSLWQEYTLQEIEHIASFCQEKGISAVTVYEQYWTEEIQKIFTDKQILVYVYTVNSQTEADRYRKAGVAGVCTDVLLERDQEKSKNGQ